MSLSLSIFLNCVISEVTKFINSLSTTNSFALLLFTKTVTCSLVKRPDRGTTQAPVFTIPKISSIISGLFPIKRATLSPLPTPISFKKFATLFIFCLRSCHDLVISPQHTAGFSG